MENGEGILERDEGMLPPMPREVFKVSSKLKEFDASDFWTSYDKTDYIGCGAFGSVRKSMHKELDGPAVVKCASLKGARHDIEKGIKNFKREANVLVRVRHPNIVRIFGVTIWSHNVGIVLEYLPCGNLSSFLKCERIPSISWWLRTMFAHQLAAALAFLHHHESHVPFSHGDIKPENILLTRDLVVKLGDFGAANIIRATNIESTTLDISQTKQNTVLYAAPECFGGGVEGPAKPTAAKDMYSFAMVLYEIITRVTVYNGHNCTIMILTVNIMNGTRPRKQELDETLRSISSDEDTKMFDRLKNIMEKCYDGMPSNRPSSSVVRDLLGENLIHMDVAKVRKEISMLQSTLLAEYRESDALVRLSDFQSQFIQTSPALQHKIADDTDLPKTYKGSLAENVEDDHVRVRRRHKFEALSRRSSEKDGTESVLLKSIKGGFASGKMWRMKFVSKSQGRYLPNRVQGVVSKMDVFCRDSEACSWSEAKEALQSHFEGVEPTEKDVEVNKRAAPLADRFSFSLRNMVQPDATKLSKELAVKGVSIRAWKHPSRYAINGIVTCKTQWEIEEMAPWLGKIFCRRNIDFIQCGFDETKWLGDDRE